MQLIKYSSNLFAVIGVAITGTAQGGIIRHDRDPLYYSMLAQQPQFQAAGAVTLGSAAYGSGTLIAPDWVLTAAHATEGVRPSSLRFVIDGQTYRGQETFEHPLWQGSALVNEGYDIALIKLSEPVTGIQPASIYRGSSIIGHEVTLVGAGLQGTGVDGQVPGTAGEVRAGPNVIDGTSELLTPFLPGLNLSPNGMLIDFDNPDDPNASFSGDALPLEHEFFPGQGDSGGAYWIEDTDGVWRLASIQSWGLPNFPGDNFGRYGNVAISARLNEQVVYSWVDSLIPSPGTFSLLALAGITAVQRRRQA